MRTTTHKRTKYILLDKVLFDEFTAKFGECYLLDLEEALKNNQIGDFTPNRRKYNKQAFDVLKNHEEFKLAYYSRDESALGVRVKYYPESNYEINELTLSKYINSISDEYMNIFLNNNKIKDDTVYKLCKHELEDLLRGLIITKGSRIFCKLFDIEFIAEPQSGTTIA